MPSTRARAVVAVGLAVKPVGKPDAGNPHVRFDERGRETGCCRMAQATAPVLDSTMDRCAACLVCRIRQFHQRVTPAAKAQSRGMQRVKAERAVSCAMLAKPEAVRLA